MEERRIDLPPHRFWIREAGAGTPLILLHGLSGSSRWWDRNLDALGASHRVIAVDLIGFGRNRRMAGSPLPLTLEDTAALLSRWIASSFSEPVHLAGHSMGGQAAIEIAARAPASVRSLVLVAPTGVPFALKPREHLEGLRHPPLELIEFGPRLALDAFRAGPTSIALASARLLRTDSRESMSLVDAPTLLIWGDSDPIVPLRYAGEIRERIPQARLEVLEGAGHVAMWDRPEAFHDAVLPFLREVERASTRGRAPHASRGERPFSWAVEDCAGGICWRSSSSAPRVVLIHGLGIGSRYFRRLARALHARGIGAVAPDLPGIGFSADIEDPRMETLAAKLGAWSREAGLGPAIWVGHSTGCEIVDEVVRGEHAEVEAAVHIAPIFTRVKFPWVRLPLALALDSLREPWGLIAEAVRTYWDAGLLRILRHAWAARETLARPPSTRVPALAILGRADPLPDRDYLAELGIRIDEIPGGHGVVWTEPEAIAEILATRRGSS